MYLITISTSGFTENLEPEIFFPEIRLVFLFIPFSLGFYSTVTAVLLCGYGATVI